jgi:ATP-dependent Clp protease adaptor protein ClpS
VRASNISAPDRVEQQQSDAALERPYHLILLDDDDHTYQYVIEMLGTVLGYEPEKAYALACIVDAEGRVTIETASHDQVTRHQRQIHSYGPDPRIARCKGSMSATVEEAR